MAASPRRIERQRADDQQPVLLRLADEEREELRGRRIGPLQVVDDQDQRRAARLAAPALRKPYMSCIDCTMRL